MRFVWALEDSGDDVGSSCKRPNEIALVQHRQPAASETPGDDLPVYRVLGIRREIVAFVAVQSLVALGAWFLFS